MIIKNINVLKLADEFSNSEINIQNIVYINNDDDTQANYIFADGVDTDLVNRIIAAHDPTPIPPPRSFEQKLLNLQKNKEELAVTLDLVLTDILPNLLGGGMS